MRIVWARESSSPATTTISNNFIVVITQKMELTIRQMKLRLDQNYCVYFYNESSQQTFFFLFLSCPCHPSFFCPCISLRSTVSINQIGFLCHLTDLFCCFYAGTLSLSSCIAGIIKALCHQNVQCARHRLPKNGALSHKQQNCCRLFENWLFIYQMIYY